jgi:hypothetical protein
MGDIYYFSRLGWGNGRVKALKKGKQSLLDMR